MLMCRPFLGVFEIYERLEESCKACKSEICRFAILNKAGLMITICDNDLSVIVGYHNMVRAVDYDLVFLLGSSRLHPVFIHTTYLDTTLAQRRFF